MKLMGRIFTLVLLIAVVMGSAGHGADCDDGGHAGERQEPAHATVCGCVCHAPVIAKESSPEILIAFITEASFVPVADRHYEEFVSEILQPPKLIS